jgi:hypothetical protein
MRLPMRASWRLAGVLAIASAGAGCVHVKTAPIEVRPIHVTVDVNVRVERALEDFFGDLDQQSRTLRTPAPAQPSS